MLLENALCVSWMPQHTSVAFEKYKCPLIYILFKYYIYADDFQTYVFCASLNSSS